MSDSLPCIHKTGQGVLMPCDMCGDRGKEILVWKCDMHGCSCSNIKAIRRVRSCATCEDFVEKQ